MEVKKPKILSNNEELTLEIIQYVVKNIDNLNKELVDLEWVRVIKVEVKSQFCQTSIMIVEYIYNIDNRYIDNSKVLKILDLPKYIYRTLAWAFVEIYIYYWI